MFLSFEHRRVIPVIVSPSRSYHQNPHVHDIPSSVFISILVSFSDPYTDDLCTSNSISLYTFEQFTPKNTPLSASHPRIA
jgi:hypothetical protein